MPKNREPLTGRGGIAHDTWFLAQIEEAMREADDPNTEWAPHEVVKQDMARQRAELLARIEDERD